MKIQSIRMVLGVVVLALAQIACAAVTGSGANPASPASPTKAAATAAPEGLATTSGMCAAPKLDKPSPSGFVEKIVLAKDTQGPNKEPVNPTTTFDGKATFHAVVAIKDAPADTTVKATWYADDTNGVAECGTQIDTYELTTDGTRNIDFTLAPKQSWPVGKYRVEIFVNGATEKSLTFTVK
jgi:hypothetical protein